MKFKFWLLQGLGWLPYALLQLLIDSEDRPLLEPARLASVVLQVTLAVSASLLLRALYRRARGARWSEWRWLLTVLAASFTLAIGVDALHYALLCAAALLWPSLHEMADAQPLGAGVPLLLVMYGLWSLLYLALSRQQRLEQAAIAAQGLQLALKEAEIQRLTGQLSPHFTFNTINNIRALILQDPEQARTALGKFAAMLRYQFADASHAQVLLADELKTVHDYIDLARLQLGERLHYEEIIAPAALSLSVPKFSLQLLVENAIKHGLAPYAQPGMLRVEVGLQAGTLLMDVSNRGKLGERGANGGIGLRNLERRLHLMYPDRASLDLAQSGEWVRARVQVRDCP